jgi:exodeoxyribonuclease VII large subunit
MLRLDAAGAPQIVGVKRLTEYLRRKLETDDHLRRVAVRGELSNFRVMPRGHLGFDLKENDALLSCFAFADDAARFPGLRNGIAVVATGSVQLYAARSTCQLLVRDIRLEGVGDIQQLFEERKRKLAAEGLFDAERKRPIPRYPFRVALVSSRGANGAIDFETILRARAPHIAVAWCDTSVQGPNAAGEIVGALHRASSLDVDVIVVTRGGGRFEDLFVFSDEGVVRAVARARHPVVSAIGHTIDQQLCDFAADVHLETPSAAARALGPDLHELRARIDDRLGRLRSDGRRTLQRLGARFELALMRSKLSDPALFLAPLAQRLAETEAALGARSENGLQRRRDALRALERRLDARDPSRALAARGTALQAARFRLDNAIAARFARSARTVSEAGTRLLPAVRRLSERSQQRLSLASAHLEGKSPEAILQRGYAIVEHRGRIVRDPAEVTLGATIVARVARGTLSARVEATHVDDDQRIG